MKKEHIEKLHEDATRRFGYSAHDVTGYRQAWRIFRIMAEFVEGYQFLREMSREVTILGSARLDDGTPEYKMARDFGGLLAKNSFTTITGGGPGIMEAANRGAFEAKGESVGLNIELPFEQVLNPYVTKFTSFNYFFTRKVMLTSPANAFVLFPGGFGTMDEFFEIVDLMELGMLSTVPVVLVGKKYWQGLIDFVKAECAGQGSVNVEAIKSWHLVDSAEDAFEKVKDLEDVQHRCSLSPTNFHCEGNIDWKTFRVMAELVEGFEFLTTLPHNVTVLGTKSAASDGRYYQDAEKIGAGLANHNFAVVTGGKKGIAEAANKGAYEAGGVSVGLGMRGNGEVADQSNEYINRSLLFTFPFTRKLIVTAPSDGFVFFPGGFGTMHQLFEVLTLMQTKKMPQRPVILYGRDYWQPLEDYIQRILIDKFKTISSEDRELYRVVDSIEHTMDALDL